MKLVIDVTNKKIGIEDNISVKDLMDFLSKVVPFDELSDWSIEKTIKLVTTTIPNVPLPNWRDQQIGQGTTNPDWIYRPTFTTGGTMLFNDGNISAYSVSLSDSTTTLNSNFTTIASAIK